MRRLLSARSPNSFLNPRPPLQGSPLCDRMRAGPGRSEDRCRNQGQPLCRDTDGDYTPPLPVIATGNQSETRLLPPAHPSRNAREMVPSMPVALDFSIPPLEHLTAEERRKL